MALDISFNDPNILRGYLNQGIPQKGLDKLSRFLVVGSEGGLAYKLLAPESLVKEFDLEEAMKEPSKIAIVEVIDEFAAAMREYWDAAEAYIREAGVVAEDYNFGLVTVKRSKKIKKGVNFHSEEDFCPRAAVGGVYVGSPDEVEDFLNMVVYCTKNLLDWRMRVMKAMVKMDEASKNAPSFP